MRDTVVTSDLSTMMDTPVRGPRIVSLVWLWYQVTVLGEETVQEMTQVRFTMLEVSRNISGPPMKVVSGSVAGLLYLIVTTVLPLIVRAINLDM